jgi:hypothetical protein
LAGLWSIPALAQQPGQKVFHSAEEAGQALVTAAQRNDEKALLEILGPDGKHLVSSGDEREDARERATFVEKYQEMHRLVSEPDGSTILYIGAKNWPTPIPIVAKAGSWFFDTQAGSQEVLCRRIGQNETSAIRRCQELVTAQQEYFSMQNGQYARTLLSEAGTRNGLYWEAAAGEPQSPMGPLMAATMGMDSADRPAEVMTPYGGYLFRILTRQGKRAQGGAQNYSVQGRLTKGFAIVAYPAQYRASGVMTFIVDRKGEVLQKDLGRKTVLLAKTMREYNPGSGWLKAEER